MGYGVVDVGDGRRGRHGDDNTKHHVARFDTEVLAGGTRRGFEAGTSVFSRSRGFQQGHPQQRTRLELLACGELRSHLWQAEMALTRQSTRFRTCFPLLGSARASRSIRWTACLRERGDQGAEVAGLVAASTLWHRTINTTGRGTRQKKRRENDSTASFTPERTHRKVGWDK